MSNYWFTPKRYGYGATPINWKGWAATMAFAAMIGAASLLLLRWQPNGGTGPGALQIAAWGAAVLMLTGGFIALARMKTDGQWGWRWGK